jgi:hypothetical protein
MRFWAEMGPFQPFHIYTPKLLGTIKIHNLPDIFIMHPVKKKTRIFFEHQGFCRVPKVLGVSEISFNLYNLPNMTGQKKKNPNYPNFFE